MKQFYRVCSLFLILCVLIHMLPMGVLATEAQDSQQGLPVDSGDLSADTLVIESSEEDHILGEILEERTAYSKTFQLSSGLRIAAVYSEPVHYDKDGQWEEIDNTLRLSSTRSGNVYTNTAGNWLVSFPQKLDTNTGVSITTERHFLHFQMTGQLRGITNAVLHTADDTNISSREDATQAMADLIADASVSPMAESDALVADPSQEALRNGSEQPELTAEKAVSSLRYANVYANTDLVYDLISNQVKESIIIGQYSSELSGYQYILEMENLIPVLTEANVIELYDQTTNEPVMRMPAPFLVDSAGQYCYDVGVLLQEENGGYILSYVLPREWLADESREWPVILDPAVESVADATKTVDQTLYQYSASSATANTMNCGYESGCGAMRMFLKYTELPEIGLADVVVDAKIQLYAAEKHGSASALIEAHRITGTWDADEITWSNPPTYDTKIVDYTTCSQVGWLSWDITGIVQGWYEDAASNHGLAFKVSDSIENAAQNNWMRFYTANFTVDCQPTLTITFRNNNGLEDYWDYTSSSAGRAGTGYINNYSGNLILVRDDIGFGGTRMPVTITHIYNSNDGQKNEFGMGYGWRTNFNQRIFHSPISTVERDYYVWEDADGTAHYFLQKSGNSYADEDGLQLTLTIGGTGNSTYTITDLLGNQSFFDSNGRLVKIQNYQHTNSSINISYTSGYRISQIIDGVGRKYTFTYYSSNNLQKISYTGSGSAEISNVQFAYSNGLLTTVTYADGGKVHYDYITKGLMRYCQDVDGYKLTYTYTNASSNAKEVPSRATSITETDGSNTGGSLTFAYDYNQTTITDAEQNVQIHQFNNWGNTVSIQDDQGKAMYAQFAFNEPGETSSDTSAKGNQLRLSSKLQNTVGNMLDNSSFESSSTWTATSSDISASSWGHSNTYHGAKFLRIQNSGTGTQGAASPGFSVVKDQTYTFSAYVYSTSATVYLDLFGTSSVASSERVTNTNGWTRLEVSYTATANTTLKARIMIAGSGTIFADCVQVEAAPSASRYNLVQNGDFRFTTFWSASSGRGTPSPTAAPATELNATAYKLEGSPTATRRLSQTVAVSGSSGDSFVLAGWAMGNSVPLITGDSTAELRKFGLILTFNNTDGTKTVKEVSFNPYVTNWQYAATGVKAEKAYSSIKIELAYDYNANSAWFDGIQLFQEEFGTSYTYHNNGEVASETDIQGRTTTYVYNDKHDLTTINLPSGENVTYTYDNWHNITSATSAQGVVYTLTYDVYGNNLSVKIGGAISSTAAYDTDKHNRLTSTTDAAGKTTYYGYNAETNVLEWVRYPKDSSTTQTEYTYDSLFRLVAAAATTDTNLGLSAQYTYQSDHLTKIQTPSTVYNFTYGNFGLRSSVKVGSTQLASYSYESVTNLLKTLAYSNGDVVQYTYDNQGRLTKQTFEDNDTVTYLYDNDGILSTVKDSASGIKTKYYYDFAGRLVKYTEDGSNNNLDHTVAYVYDEKDQVTRRKSTALGSTWTVTTDYDEDGRITSATQSNVSREFTYDNKNRLTSTTLKRDSTDALVTSYVYKANTAMLSTVKLENAAGNKGSWQYLYDDNGNITRVITTVNDAYTTTYYHYDTAGQLIREDNQKAGTTTLWTYDNAGNILTEKVYAHTTGTPSTLRKTNTYTYTSTQWGDLLTSYNGNMIYYDGLTELGKFQVGNPTTYYNGTAWTFTWEHGRQLATITQTSTGTTWTNTYNSDGLRTSRSDGTTTYTYIYEDGRLSAIKRNDLNMWIIYDDNGPVTLKYGSGTFHYVTNPQGDVVAIVGNQGQKLVEYTYDAWGKVTSITGDYAYNLGIHNPILYRGYVYDHETGLYYCQSRYYDPQTHRFLNADAFASTGQGLLGNNMFAYCGNNPVMYSDPSGEVSILSMILRVVVTNNVINAVYYEISDGDSTLSPVSYQEEKVSRWERLDYAKQQTQEEHYFGNAWRYHSEYSVHEYGWYATSWAYNKDIPVFSQLAEKFCSAEVSSDSWDDRWYVNLATVLWGLLGF